MKSKKFGVTIMNSRKLRIEIGVIDFSQNFFMTLNFWRLSRCLCHYSLEWMHAPIPINLHFPNFQTRNYYNINLVQDKFEKLMNIYIYVIWMYLKFLTWSSPPLFICLLCIKMICTFYGRYNLLKLLIGFPISWGSTT